MNSVKKLRWGLLLVSCVFLSCATNQTESTSITANNGKQNTNTVTATNTQGNKPNLIVRGSEQDPAELEKYQFLSVTDTSANPVYLTATNWSKVRIISDFLDEIKGHRDFSNEKKFELLSYIFDDLPINGDDGIVREVYVGKYFEINDPLIIRVGVLTPENDGETKSDKVIVLLTNVFKLPDGSITKKAGGFVDFDSNVWLLCGLKNALLTNSQKMENKEIQITEESTGIEKVMIAQAYLNDENEANDIEAEKVITQIISENKEMPAIIIMAMILKYDYFLSIEDIPSAGNLWSEILTYSKNVPGDMNPESLEAMNGESIYLMGRLLERNRN